MPHLKRRIGCMSGPFVALQKILTSKAKKKNNILIVFVVEKKNVLRVSEIYHITEKGKEMNRQRYNFQCRQSLLASLRFFTQ